MNFFRALTSRAPSDPAVPRETTRDAILNGVPVTVLLRRHPRARRIKLAIDPARGRPVLTMPPGVAEGEALGFLERNAGWTLEALARLPSRVDIAPDGVLPYRGLDHVVRHRPDARRGVFVEDGALVVSGPEEHLPRRVTDFLKREAGATIKPLARDMAARIDRKPGRVSVRDQRTRWGSCAANGDLSFSFRLILAPPEILDYVVAHEVSHLVHMNHSKAFWATVGRLYPDWRAARDWLSEHGGRLHRIG
jgi:predicted metal-dependent hydrolase